MSKITVHAFTNVDDADPKEIYDGDEYVAVSDTPSSHRIVINPNHADPKKQKQLHVRDGERNATDPLRFQRVEVYDDANVFVAGFASDGRRVDPNAEPEEKAYDSNALNTQPVDSKIAPLNPVANDAELKLQPLIDTGADDDELEEAIDDMDYKTLEAELLVRKLEVPKKANDRRLVLKDAVLR